MEQIFNPRRLEKALTFRCLNASNLAEELNVSRQTVSGYKNGKVVPRIEQVHDIARVLKMPIKFFYEYDYKESISPVYFRSQLTTKKTYREYQKVKIEFTEQLYKFISEYINFPALNLPKFSSNNPKIVARELREYWGLGFEPIKNIITLVEKNGIIVSCCSTNTDAIDAFSKKVILDDGYETFFIGYSENKKSAARIHFDVAHELGHICLHGWANSEELDKEEFVIQEKEAHDFASEFLLPEETFKFDVERIVATYANYAKLKEKWKTSIVAMLMRSYKLGVITYETYQKEIINMAKRGVKKQEPLDDRLITAEPTLLNTAVMLLLTNDVFSKDEFVNEFRKGYNLTINLEDMEQLLNLPKGTLFEPRIIEFKDLTIKK